LGELSGLPRNLADGIDVQKLAERLAEVLRDGQVNLQVAYTNTKLATVAHAIYRSRRRRNKFFDSDLFADPTWDMLLDLFVNQVRGVRVSVTSLTLAACVPSTTGLRCIRILVERGLATRTRAADDARLVLLELTPKGFQLMRQYVIDGIARQDLPAAE
jgi:hypothetical protein